MALPATSDEEIDALLSLAGLVVPPDLKAGVASEIRDLRRMAALLRNNRPSSAEPSNIFRLAPRE
jgi:hypothetical protein